MAEVRCQGCGVSGGVAEICESGGRWLCRQCYLGAQTAPAEEKKAARPAGRAPKRQPGRTANEAGDSLPLTDLGNAERFVRLFGGEVRFSHERRLWLVWNGRYWQWDDGDVRVMSLARKTVRNMYQEAADEPDDSCREAVVKHAQRSESCQRLVAITRLGQSGEGVPIKLAELDADPWLFNCGNGTLDLRTGKLRQHRREDLITMTATVDYDPAAGCPLWLSLLDRVTGGSVELQAYLQRAVGYSLTGDTSSQVVFFLWGQGSNGKSTFVSTIRRLAGPYGARLDMNALTTRGSSGPRESLADLCGKRFVAASEIEDGSRLAVSLIKDLSGGESIRADRKYEHGFEFQPQLKLWLSGNHRPVIADNTYSIWRRLKLIPFVVTIPADEVDPRYPSRLEAEMPGILAWAVEGCLQWQRCGLGEPDVVARETGGYRREQDVLADFCRGLLSFWPLWRASARPICGQPTLDGAKRTGPCPWARGASGPGCWRWASLMGGPLTGRPGSGSACGWRTGRTRHRAWRTTPDRCMPGIPYMRKTMKSSSIQRFCGVRRPGLSTKRRTGRRRRTTATRWKASWECRLSGLSSCGMDAACPPSPWERAPAWPAVPVRYVRC